MLISERQNHKDILVWSTNKSSTKERQKPAIYTSVLYRIMHFPMQIFQIMHFPMQFFKRVQSFSCGKFQRTPLCSNLLLCARVRVPWLHCALRDPWLVTLCASDSAPGVATPVHGRESIRVLIITRRDVDSFVRYHVRALNM